MKSKSYATHYLDRIPENPVDMTTSAYKSYKEKIHNFKDQAVYIYSIKQNKLLFANGWLDVLGYKDEEITMQTIVLATIPHFLPFSLELGNKALEFISNETENLEDFSFTLQLKKKHKNGDEVPLLSRVGVYKADNGVVEEIISVTQIVSTLRFGKVMQYAAFGPPGIERFEDFLCSELFSYSVISSKEKEALMLSAQGKTYKEIAAILNVSQSAIEKRIFPLYKRFNVQSLPHLINFAHHNHILP